MSVEPQFRTALLGQLIMSYAREFADYPTDEALKMLLSELKRIRDFYKKRMERNPNEPT